MFDLKFVFLGLLAFLLPSAHLIEPLLEFLQEFLKELLKLLALCSIHLHMKNLK